LLLNFYIALAFFAILLLIMSQLEKGFGAVVALLIVATLGVGGYYIYSKGYLNSNLMNSKKMGDYSLSTPVPVGSAVPDNNESVVLTTSQDIALNVTSPLNGITITTGKVVTVKGKTTAGAEVFVNDQSTMADANGNFSVVLTLDEGPNNIVVTVNDVDGNVAEQSLSVNVQTF